MSLRSLESAIWREAQQFFNNRKIRLKDIMEWSTGSIDPGDGEVVERLPKKGIYVAIMKDLDKRKGAARG